jgi:hypothetical protein
MAKITNLTEFKNYILVALGFPVLNIEISNEQLEQCIELTIEDFQRYNQAEGSYRDYFILSCSAGVEDYPVSAIRDFKTGEQLDNVEGVWDFSVSFGADGINTLFSPAHILLYNQYVEQGSYPGGPGQGSPGGLVLANYQISMMYLDQINEMFGKMYSVAYLPGREVIRITPTPTAGIVGVLILWRKEYAYNLYNNVLVKKLAIARAKLRWGRNLNKYGGTMPDGLTVNAADIIAEGKEEEEKWFDRMWDESQPGDFIVA